MRMVLLAIGTVAAFVGAVVLTVTLTERAYLRTTTPEVRATHEAMAQRLREAENGSFVLFKDGRLSLLAGNTPAGNVRRHNSLRLQHEPGSRFLDHAPRILGRAAVSVVAPDDPGWPALAKKFLVGE